MPSSPPGTPTEASTSLRTTPYGTAPAPIKLSRETIAAEIAAACKAGVPGVTKLMRKYLKLRTGIAWSVTNSRGSSYGWIDIHATPARRTEKFGYLSTADRIALGLILGADPGAQGETLRPGAGVRELYLWKLAGHDAPADLRVAATDHD